MDEPLTVKFTHSNTISDKKPYTVYEIEVRSSSTIQWILYKRFSAFVELHDLLQKFVSDSQATLGQIKLPALPPKRLTRVLASEFVEKRKTELQEYTRGCLQIPAILHSEAMLNFLEVPASVRPMVRSQPAPAQKSNPAARQTSATTSSNASAARFGDVQYSTRTPEEKHVIELVFALRTSANKVAAIRTFESWFFNTRPRLTNEYIRILFEGAADQTAPATPSTGGDGPNAGLGLVQTCGDFRHSRCAARASLYLIARLLDPERNREATAFVDVLATLPSALLQRFRFHMHISSSRGNRPAAFGIIHTLQEYTETRFAAKNTYSGIGAGSGQNQITLETLVQEVGARQEYLKWLRVKNAHHQHIVATTLDASNNSISLLRGNTVSQYKSLIHAGFQQLLQICGTDVGWHEVQQVASGAVRATDSPGIDVGAASHPTAAVAAAAVTTGASGIAQSQTTASAAVPSLHISNAYQKNEEANIFTLRSCVLFPFAVDEVIKVLTIPQLIPLWDEKVHSADVTQQFDQSSDILHLVYHTNGSFYQHKDFSLLRSVIKLKDGSIILLYRSVNIPSCGEVKGYQRSIFHPSGFIVSPLSPTETLVTLILQLDNDSVLLYASDLLGESHDLSLSWHNLFQLMADHRQQ